MLDRSLEVDLSVLRRKGTGRRGRSFRRRFVVRMVVALAVGARVAARRVMCGLCAAGVSAFGART